VRLLRVAAVVVALGLLSAGAASAQSPPSPTFDRGEPDPSIADGSAQRKLDRARRRWRRAGIHNYRFQPTVICFCVRRDPVVIFVRNDRPVNAPDTLRDVATVRRLHRAVQRAIDRKVPDLSVRYDRRGIPREISIDNIKNAADDEVAYRVDRFWRGTKGRGGPDAPVPPGPAPR
jgi:hypothetical protein